MNVKSILKDQVTPTETDGPTDISSEVYMLSKQLFAELWDGHTPLRLIGVALTELQ